MNTVILSCESLEVYVAAAQKTAGTTYPVIWLKQKYHEEPAVMRSHILETIASLPKEVDTGMADCYSEAFVEMAQRSADLIKCDLDYTVGSNHLLEKLVSGQWDEQFLMAEPGHKIAHKDFFE